MYPGEYVIASNRKSTQASRYAGDRVRQCQTTNRTMRTDKPTKTTRNSLDKIQVSMVEGGSKASTRNSPDIIQVSVVEVELRRRPVRGAVRSR